MMALMHIGMSYQNKMHHCKNILCNYKQKHVNISICQYINILFQSKKSHGISCQKEFVIL
jgi:hypothetical protein